MSKVLIFTELNKDKVKPVTLEILGKLNGKNAEVAVFGDLDDSQVKLLAQYGANKVHKLKGDNLNKYSPEGYANALKGFIDGGNYDYVLTGATPTGKDLFPRLASMFSAGMASDITNFLFEDDVLRATRPLFAGKCLAKVEVTGPKPHFFTVRPNALGMPEAPTAAAGESADSS